MKKGSHVGKPIHPAATTQCNCPPTRSIFVSLFSSSQLSRGRNALGQPFLQDLPMPRRFLWWKPSPQSASTSTCVTLWKDLNLHPPRTKGVGICEESKCYTTHFTGKFVHSTFKGDYHVPGTVFKFKGNPTTNKI